jgi:hypothetical protein
MANRRPGPICSSQFGPDWIDTGTMCRSRSIPPGPRGFEASHIPVVFRLTMSLVIGAAPNKQRRSPVEKAMLGDDIERIARSPFGRTPEGRDIVELLRNLDAHERIAYGETGGARGDFYGTGITVNKDYYGNMCKTILEMVHEASHAMWRAKHPIRKGKVESVKEAADNELYAQENQLQIYTWLKDAQRLCNPDPEMELRLERQARGTLRSVIEENVMKERNE